MTVTLARPLPSPPCTDGRLAQVLRTKPAADPVPVDVWEDVATALRLAVLAGSLSTTPAVGWFLSEAGRASARACVALGPTADAGRARGHLVPRTADPLAALLRANRVLARLLLSREPTDPAVLACVLRGQRQALQLRLLACLTSRAA